MNRHEGLKRKTAVVLAAAAALCVIAGAVLAVLFLLNDRNLREVSVTVPLSYLESEYYPINSEQQFAGASSSYISGEDGTMTAVFSVEAYDQMMADLSSAIDAYTGRWVNDSDNYPHILNISHDEDFSTFTVETDGIITDVEKETAEILLYEADLYQSYSVDFKKEKDFKNKVEFTGKDGSVIKTVEAGSDEKDSADEKESADEEDLADGEEL